MCGIFFLKYFKNKKINEELILKNFNKIQHRGPDKSVFHNNDAFFIGFHRLAINGITPMGDQPFEYIKGQNKVYVMCNGEIYNYRELNKKYGLGLKEGMSDCAVIYPLFLKVGLEKMIDLLDGVFAFVIYDTEDNSIYAGRDPIGVRPLFYGYNEEEIGFASEAKALSDLMEVVPFPPGSYFSTHIGHPKHFFDIEEFKDCPPNHYLTLMNDTQIYESVRNVFIKAVRKRMLSERPIGSLLSGGLDSSLVASIVQREMRENGMILNTYSIGFEGSPDLKYARKVADFIGSNHHEVILDMDDILHTLPEIIRQLETWDTTTIRASIGMYFLSKYIKENSEDVVIFSGEGVDELCQGYLYFHRQPNEMMGHMESMRLMRNLYMYDVLRADRTTAAHGLELRVPFLDKDFMKLITSLPYRKVCPRKGIEKYLVRKAFDGFGYLPEDILWRTKEAFSDGVSSEHNNWLDKLKQAAEVLVTGKEVEYYREVVLHCVPRTREEVLYRKIFREYYRVDEWIGDYWMPKWSPETNDPSARTLKLYSEKMKSEQEETPAVL